MAFPGSGLDRSAIYPVRHYRLAEQIVKSGGALLSPFKPDQLGIYWTFPQRNLLMAACSHATLVIEGREKSGTSITAGHALEFSRELLIVPGSIFSPLSNGPTKMWKDGARPVTSSEEILDALGLYTAPAEESETDKLAKGKSTDAQTNSLFDNLEADHRRIIKELLFAPSSLSDLAFKLKMSASSLNVTITKLELDNLILEKDGIYFVKNLISCNTYATVKI
jgi:DNA processing protein